MNRNDLIKRISKDSGIDAETTSRVLAAYERQVSNALKSKEEIKLHGFGKYYLRSTNAHTSRNPKTGEVITAKAATRPVFKFADRIEKELNTEANIKKD